MPFTAEDSFGIIERLSACLGQPGKAIFADTDDGQPGISHDARPHSGGTADASLLAAEIARAGIDAVYSYGGRTRAPAGQPLPTRIGGFGGVGGLADYIRREEITHVIDSTHPFAAKMSRNAVAACAETGTPLIALERAPWTKAPGDNWIEIPDVNAAVAALPKAAANSSRSAASTSHRSRPGRSTPTR